MSNNNNSDNNKEKIRPRKSISLRGKIDPFLLNYITLGIIIIFIVTHSAITHEMLIDQNKEGKERSELIQKVTQLTEYAVKQNDVMIKIQEAQGNISDDARARIINNMETILPALNQTVQHINEQFDNHSEQVKRHDQSLKDAIKILEVPQSNFTAQKMAIANIEKVLENQEEILQRLNSSLS